ncbi:hypothetical protein KCP74_07290 [Salmonella enterica subsp. enterica]|nr:hypothetical protein KCP74_07290 [Salmonella enterica subsp. enterica]
MRRLSIIRRRSIYRLSAKTLDDDAAARVVGRFSGRAGALRRSTTCPVRTRWEHLQLVGFWRRAGYAEENPLPAVAVVRSLLDFQSTACLICCATVSRRLTVLTKSAWMMLVCARGAHCCGPRVGDDRRADVTRRSFSLSANKGAWRHFCPSRYH